MTTTIAFNKVTAASNTTQLQKKQQQPIRNLPLRCRRQRRNRICNLSDDDNDNGYEQIRRSLRDPWCDPNNLNVNRNDDDVDDDDIVHSTDHTKKSSTTASATPSSALIFREWVQWLATSQCPRHLQTLRILLAEAAGRNGLTNSPYSSSGGTPVGDEVIDNDGTSTTATADVWWDLCYPSIATTIQRIVYRKLIRSKNNNNSGSKKPKLNSRNTTDKRTTNNTFSGTNSTTSNDTKNIDDRSSKLDRRYRIGKIKDRLKQLPMVGVVVIPNNTDEEDTTTSMEIDLDYDPDTSYIERKYGYSKDEDEDGTINNNRGNIEDDINITTNEEEEEDRVLSLALAVWIGLLQVASSKQLDDWYADRKGLGPDDGSKRRKQYGNNQSSSPPSGGLFMMCILMDLLEELQFGQWLYNETANGRSGRNSMSSSRLLSSGLKSNNVSMGGGGNNRKNIDSSNSNSVEYMDVDDDDDDDGDDDDDKYDDSFSSSSSTIPRWYNIAIAVLAQVGRTENGMKLLRTRSTDDRVNDWMGNALDVSIRQLHTLALHLDDVQTREGSIVRLGGKCTCGVDAVNSNDIGNGNGNGNHNCNYNDDDTHTARLRRSVEAWVRLWHQVLLFVHHHQQKQEQQQTVGGGTTIISFRSLVLDVRDWYTSTCATLMTSEMIRPEIQSMIRWQLDELLMDEEDYEESKHYSR